MRFARLKKANLQTIIMFMRIKKILITSLYTCIKGVFFLQFLKKAEERGKMKIKYCCELNSIELYIKF